MERFLARMAELMTKQTKQPPPILTNSDIAFLGQELKEACSVLQGLGLPDTLSHIDFNPGNILVSPEKCIFLDWAEGCLTNPLITFEYLREHARRNHLDAAAATEQITAAYLRPWQSLINGSDLRRGVGVSSLMAILAYGVALDARRSSDALENLTLAAYLRSLTRRMYREAVRIKRRSELCLH
jgi:hypothetical protein